MTYKVEISPTAIADIEQIFLWVQEYSVDTAHRWVRKRVLRNYADIGKIP